MDMLEFLRTRRTYRRFEQRPVALEILTEAVDAARIASCGANRQTVRYIVVQSADAVAAVQPLVHWAAYLPPEQGQPKPDELPTAFIAVLQDDNLPGASDVDVGLALGSLTAAAWAHSVGSCIMGAIDRPALTRLLALPDGVRLCYMVALGYPTHASKLVEMQDGSVKYYLDENREAQHGRGAAENAVKVKIAVPMIKSGLRFFVSVRSGVFQPYPKIAKLCAPRDSVSLTISALPMVY